MFRMLFTLIFLGGAFLGGYYLGHQPGSPDIFAWAQDTYNHATNAGNKLSAVIKGEPGNVLETVGGGEDVAVEVDGKVYYVNKSQLHQENSRQ